MHMQSTAPLRRAFFICLDRRRKWHEKLKKNYKHQSAKWMRPVKFATMLYFLCCTTIIPPAIFCLLAALVKKVLSQSVQIVKASHLRTANECDALSWSAWSSTLLPFMQLFDDFKTPPHNRNTLSCGGVLRGIFLLLLQRTGKRRALRGRVSQGCHIVAGALPSAWQAVTRGCQRATLHYNQLNDYPLWRVFCICCNCFCCCSCWFSCLLLLCGAALFIGFHCSWVCCDAANATYAL